MAGRRNSTTQNPLAGLVALAGLAEALQGLNGTPATPEKKAFSGGREGYRSVAVVSLEEAVAIVAAAKEGKEQTIVVNGRETVIEVLDEANAAKFKGGFRIHRRPLPTA